MPRDRSRSRRDSSRLALREQIRNGRVVPIISQETMADLVLGGWPRLVQHYADYAKYPLDDRSDLLHMAKYSSIEAGFSAMELKTDYLEFIKNELYDVAKAQGCSEEMLDEAEAQRDHAGFGEYATLLDLPKFEGAQENPLLILADLALPIYLTTCCHTFLEKALEKAGRTVRTDFCRWHPDTFHFPSVFDNAYVPTPSEPLVYHLFGLDEYPDSIILTEDDYLQFLVAVSQDKGQKPDPIHSVVRGFISSSYLLLLGFSLPSWSFRMLFWGLIKPAPPQDPRADKGTVSIQLNHSELEQKYLESYLRHDARLKAEWQDIHGYTRELHALWRGTL